MKQSFPKLALTAAAVTVLALYGCGGGSSPSAEMPPAVTPAAVTLTGTAAKGAPFNGALLAVFDSTGARVDSAPATVGADGKFSVTLNAGAIAPFVLVATRTSDNGDTETLVSVAESASVTQVNVTPITTLIASRLTDSGDPSKLATELQGGASITAAEIQTTVAEVQAILQPLLDTTGTTGTNPLTGSFDANGQGYDRLLDSVSISIVPASATETNIEIAVKSTDNPTPLTFSSSTPSVTPVAAVTGSTLVQPGTSVKIADFLRDLTACYAVPFEDRVDGATTGVNAVTGTAVNVTAPACRAVFWGGDPANFKNNGGLVGRNASNGGAFASLFRRGATNVVFSQGTYEFTRSNGDLVIGYKSRGTDGSETFDTLVVRNDPADSKLKLIGNQYQFPGGVTAYQQHRQFIAHAQSAYNYRSTGYTVNVDDRKDNAGNSIFTRVEVTTPRGNTLTLKPVAGYSYLNLVKSTGATVGTNFLRLRSAFDNGTTTATFATMEPGLFFSNVGFTDADIAAIPAQSTWTFKYFFTPGYLAANPTVSDGVTQTFKTRARALTIAELQTRGLAQLSELDITDIQAQATPKGIDFEGAADNAVHWTVPAGALPPTSVKFWGNLFDTTTGAKLQGFEDSSSFSSTLRQAPLTPCSSTGAGDNHCSSTPVAGSYAAGAFVNSLHLWARDSAGREFASFYAWYQLNLAP